MEGGDMRARMGDGVSVTRVCAVLQDCADQLSVLGCTMFLNRKNINPDPDMQNSPGYMTKVRHDLNFATRLITELMTELKQEKTFYSLVHTMDEEKRIKDQLQHIVMSEERDGKRIKSLQKELVDVRKDTALQIRARDEDIARLRDELKDLGMRKRLQENYLNNSTRLLVYQGEKLNRHNENKLEDEIEMLKKRLREEENNHKELVDLFIRNQKLLEDKLEYWIDRCDKENEDKRQEIYITDIKKNKNQATFQDLGKKCKEMEQEIHEDRMEKERLQKEEMERNAAMKIQTWWRKTMISKCLGPFKKKSKQKKKEKKKKK